MFLAPVCTAVSQVVQGYVFDAKTKEPIIGASVYFDGSSLGVITDLEGRFNLEVRVKTYATLIISHIGYESEHVQDPFKDSFLRIGLQEKVQEIPEVVLTSDPFSRKQKLKLFKLEFLGDTKASKSCTILNEDSVKLFFNSYDNTLTAYSNEPLIVENEYLGYHVKFEINEFKVFFRRKSLERLDNILYTIYAGYTQFTDLGGHDNKIQKRRHEAYLGSAMHFIRSCWKKDWWAQNFSFKKNSKMVPGSEIIEVTTDERANFKTIHFKYKDFAVYHRKKSSYRSTVKIEDVDTFSIDRYGKFMPYKNLIFGGYMAELRIADLLPIDYQP